MKNRCGELMQPYTIVTYDKAPLGTAQIAAVLHDTLSYFDIDGSPDHFDVAAAIQNHINAYTEQFFPISIENCTGKGDAFLYVPHGTNPNGRPSYMVYGILPHIEKSPLRVFHVSSLPIWSDMLKPSGVITREKTGRDGFDERIVAASCRFVGIHGGKIRNIAINKEQDITLLAGLIDSIVKPLAKDRDTLVTQCLNTLTDHGYIGAFADIRTDIKNALTKDISRMDITRTELARARFMSHADVRRLNILQSAPSQLTVDSYNALSFATSESPHKFYDFCEKYPIAIPVLLQGKMAHTLRKSRNPEMALFGTNDPFVLKQYASMRESITGEKAGRELPRLMPYFNFTRLNLALNTPEKWADFTKIVSLAEHLASPLVLKRTARGVFKDITQTLHDEDDWNYFVKTYADRDRSFIGHYLTRIGHGIVMPKLLTRAHDLNLRLNFNQAAYITTHMAPVENTTKQLRRYARRNHEPSLLQQFLAPANADNLLPLMLHFGAHNANAQHHNIRNALFHNGAQYPFPALPERDIDGYAVRPIRSMAELLQDSFAGGHHLWQQGEKAVIDASYFVSVRKHRTGKSVATALIHLDSDGTLSLSESVSSAGGRSNYAAMILDDYIAQIQGETNAAAIKHDQIRIQIKRDIAKQESMADKIGHDPFNAQENKQACEELRPYIPFKFGTDRNGCLSSPSFDHIVEEKIKNTGLKKRI